MIITNIAQELRLIANDLVFYPFIIIASIGHVARAIGYTREPLELSFQVKSRDPPAPLLLRCAVIDATNNNTLVG